MTKCFHSIQLLLLVVCAVICWPGVAGAQDQDRGEAISAAVLDLEGKGVDEELANTLTSIVRNEAQQVDRYKVVNKFDINFRDVLLVLGCNAESPSCLKQAAEKVDARLLIFGEVSKREGAYRITLNIFDAESGKMVNRLVRTIGESDDPVVAFRKEIEVFFREEQTVPVTVVQIGSNIEDAKIKIDNTYVGMVPLERKGLPPGNYTIEVYHPDYESWKTVLELQEGADIQLWAPLSPPDAAAATPPAATSATETQSETVIVRDVDEEVESVPTFNWGAWSAIGVGGIALGASGVFAILMSSTEDDITAERDRGTLTTDRYDELVERGESYELTHRVLLGVGVVGVATGLVWLFLADESGAPSERAGLDVVLRPDGVQASVQW